LLGRLPRRTIVLSDHVGSFIQAHGRIPREAITRIYYGLDPAPFFASEVKEARASVRKSLGLAPEEVVFLCVARFAPQKDHATLLKAFARARSAERGGALRLLLVGDDPFGSRRAGAEALSEKLGLSDKVVFTGIRRDVPQLLAASDAFVMPSLWEGLGLVFLEAMAAGLPILATRVSAVPEVVLDGESGVLVPPADPEALARGMLDLSADPKLRARMGRAGEARVRELFGLEAMVERTIAVYQELRGRAAG
jgi:glycosyltransferase involved in cell wall biosynthesis